MLSHSTPEQNEAKLKDLFSKSLNIKLDLVTDDLAYNGVKEWDSVAHMALIGAIDDQFSIMLETDDIIGLSSFKTAKEILQRYQIAI